ncbi:MAG: transposase [Opitutaceae bacterium]
MARKLRMEEEGGFYHVLNRGNYRQWPFKDDGAKLAFETTLFEACARAQWVLHAYCIMGNHYHLALEMPQGNLTAGMRWLQSVYASRFNRFRAERGHLFQGRFKSLAVEDRERLGWLAHYIHLNPVRARICEASELASYRWSSLWYLNEPRQRPAFLNLETCLAGAGGLKDTPAGRRNYGRYLAWLAADEPARKAAEFERMSRGWAIGSTKFQEAVAQEEQKMRASGKLTQAEARAARELVWLATLKRCMRVLGRGAPQAQGDAKSADWKVAIAAFMKQRLLGTNQWLAQQLNMGSPFAVSRYAGELEQGKRRGASKLHATLKAKVKP